MLYSQHCLVSVISDEIEDRTTREEGCVDSEEIDGLIELKNAVLNEQPLTFIQYQWLCDLVSAETEMKTMSE